MLKVLNQRRIVEEAQEDLMHDVFKHEIVVIVCRCLLHVLRKSHDTGVKAWPGHMTDSRSQ